MKSVAFFMHGFNGGGAERVTITTANLLSQKGYDVALLMKNTCGPLKDMVSEGVKVVDFNINKTNFFERILGNVAHMVRFKHVVENDKYDIIFIVARPMCFVASVASMFTKKGNTKVVSIIHNSINNENLGFNKIKNIIIRKRKKFFNFHVVVSKDAANEFSNYMNDQRVCTIYNPIVDLSLASKKDEEVNHKWLIEKKYPVFVTAGRLTSQKNYKWLIEVFAELQKELDSRLIILGDGELKSELIKYAKTLRVESKIDFLGFQSNPYPYFKHSTAFLLSSNYEGLPTVLIEALSCGCNIVSTDCPTGPSEILCSGKYGKLVKIGDKKSFVDAVVDITEHPYDKNDLIKRAMNFSYEKSIKDYIDLIDHL